MTGLSCVNSPTSGPRLARAWDTPNSIGFFLALLIVGPPVLAAQQIVDFIRNYNRNIIGSEEWRKNQYVLNKSNMFLYSNIYIKYVNGLLRRIGMDIQTKDESLGDIE